MECIAQDTLLHPYITLYLYLYLYQCVYLCFGKYLCELFDLEFLKLSMNLYAHMARVINQNSSAE